MQDPVLRWQPILAQMLLGQLRRDRVAHAYLFVGVSPPGPEELAQWWAGRLLDTPHPERHPGFVRVEPQGETLRIDQVRQLIQDSAVRAWTGSRRVFLLGGVHRFTREAANAFLKILEEPLPGVTWLLTSPALGLVLPTIVSRCQVFGLRPPAEEEEEGQAPEGVAAALVWKRLVEEGPRAVVELAQEAEKASDTWLVSLERWFRRQLHSSDPGTWVEAVRVLQQLRRSLQLRASARLAWEAALWRWAQLGGERDGTGGGGAVPPGRQSLHL